MAGLMTYRISYVNVLLLVCAKLVSCRNGDSNPGEHGNLAQVTRQGRLLLQEEEVIQWELFPVLDFGGFYQAAVEAGDPDRNIHVIVQNHITAQGRGLDMVVRGASLTPFMTSSCLVLDA